jgi:hypothetical protein
VFARQLSGSDNVAGEFFSDVGVTHGGQENASLTLTIAGCLGFLTFSQFGDVPAR